MQSDLSTITVTAPHTVAEPTATHFWESARQLGCPAALWRLPNQQEKHLIIHLTDVLPRVSADLEELPAGFAVSPFDNLDNGPDNPARTLFLRADVHVVFSEGTITQLNYASGHQAEALQRLVSQQLNNPPTSKFNSIATKTMADGDAQSLYEQNVAEAVAEMQQERFRKVVLSRTKRVEFDETPDVVAIFDKLCLTYPTAFVSAVFLPERGQVWISATPERLVSVDDKGIFRTLSLAGTQSAFDAAGQPKRPSEAMWSQKEIEEQALVSRYIIECFKKIRLREYLEEGPKTIIAGNLMHLGTRFSVDTQAVRYPQLGTVMLRLLHPTSAVCGMPRDAAYEFIRTHEPHDRELYSGFLGPVNVANEHGGPESHLFVHIRCLKLEGNVATLYAGAGLTEDSVPEREWQETEMKCQTLLNVLTSVTKK
ncbi:Chorismate binding-like protein [Fibrisoma limi BUZ 3]|uniref:isochorismate synthase n=1 Tax=Fibrisoma limi BUZ 3 TaxID=1185876 RepID=I2GNH2_9BACT|nr:isochorismate synthase [Fibrisoma limi]CCH55450.1 Chorismate binding-like protein [Fibrisoma limi BUZ 3]